MAKKCGMFRRDVNYRHVDQELAGRAFAQLYGLHRYMVKKEEVAQRKKDRLKVKNK